MLLLGEIQTSEEFLWANLHLATFKWDFRCEETNGEMESVDSKIKKRLSKSVSNYKVGLDQPTAGRTMFSLVSNFSEIWWPL